MASVEKFGVAWTVSARKPPAGALSSRPELTRSKFVRSTNVRLHGWLVRRVD